MPVDLRATAFGPPATAALRGAIDEAQRADPLARVTVVVPRTTVGLAARRALAGGAGAAGPRSRGIFNVQFLTVTRFARDLAANPLAASGRSPGTPALVAGAARAVLASVEADGTVFAPSRDHSATARSLVAAYRDLRDVPPDALGELSAQSARAADVVRLVTAMRGQLAPWYDEVDEVDAATAAIAADPTAVLAPLGQVVAHLPLTLRPHHVRLLRTVADAAGLVVVAGVTGSAEADGTVGDLAERLGSPGRLPPVPVPVADRIVSAPSADAEALAVVRQLMARAEAGVALERLAVAHAGGDHARLMTEALDQAAIPYNSPGIRPLAATVAGRVLLGMWDLPDTGWRRDAVVAWMSTGPLLDGGRPLPAAFWDRVSREAGVVEGLDQWQARLEAHAAHLEEELGPESGDVGSARRNWSERERDETRRMAAFVAELAERLGQRPSTWAEWAAWARSAVTHFLGDPARRARWERPQEAEACTTLDEALGQLTALDRLDPAPSPSAFRAALEDELTQPAPQTTRFGRGVFVAPLDELAGLDLDTIFVVGMNDGALPPVVRDDPLLPDAERVSVGDVVPLRTRSRSGDARRDYLAALAAAEHRVLTFPRGDPHGGRELRPSRWLLESATALAGETDRLFAADLGRVTDAAWFEQIPSFQAAVAADGAAGSLVDWDRRALLAWHASGRRLADHPLVGVDGVLAAGLTAKRARRSLRFTRFDGRVGPPGDPSSLTSRVQSATGLESFASCPRRYFFRTVLRVEEDQEPERLLRISPLDRGVLVHEILEAAVGAELAGAVPDLPALAEEAFGRFEAEGRTGRPLLWRLDRAEILRDLHTFAVHDRLRRAATGERPVAVEVAFGFDDDPLEVTLGGGRTVRFRGKIDRVDRGPAGITVTDYKTGGNSGYDELRTDPVARGERLQLVVYGLAARRNDGAAVKSGYWFVSERGDFARIEIDLDDDTYDRFTAVLEVLADAIEMGVFPGRPGEPDHRNSYSACRYCPYDVVCPSHAERGATWSRVSAAGGRDGPDAALAAYVALAEPAPDGPEGTP